MRYTTTPGSILYPDQFCSSAKIPDFFGQSHDQKASSLLYFNSLQAGNNFDTDKLDTIPLRVTSNIENGKPQNSSMNNAKVLEEDKALGEDSAFNTSQSSIDNTQSTDGDSLINISTSTQSPREIKSIAMTSGEGTVGKATPQKKSKFDRSTLNRFYKHSRLSFRQHLNKCIQLSHEILSTDHASCTEVGPVVITNKDNASSKAKSSSHKQWITRCGTVKTLSAPSMRVMSMSLANGEYTAVWDHSSISCCPLLEIYSTLPHISMKEEEDINLSPFKLWGFKPFLQPRQNAFYKTKHTLVLDLDETLVSTSVEHVVDADAVLTVQIAPTTSEPRESKNISCRKMLVVDGSMNNGNRHTPDSYVLYVKYRPHLKEFLDFCLEHFEVVVFTASKKYYAIAVLRQLQEDFGIQVVLPDDPLPDDHTRARRTITLLHRDHCTPTNAGFVKDLFMLGRNLRTTVLVDNVATCGSFQPFNVIRVKDFMWCQLVRLKNKAYNKIGGLDACSQTLVPTDSCEPFLSSKLNIVNNRSALDNDFDKVELNCSMATWEYFDDNVLQTLVGPGGVLQRMVYCIDVPHFLFQTMLRSVDAAGAKENALN